MVGGAMKAGTRDVEGDRGSTTVSCGPSQRPLREATCFLDSLSGEQRCTRRSRHRRQKQRKERREGGQGSLQYLWP